MLPIPPPARLHTQYAARPVRSAIVCACVRVYVPAIHTARRLHRVPARSGAVRGAGIVETYAGTA